MSSPVDLVEVLLDEPVETGAVDLVEVLLDEPVQSAPVDLVEVSLLASERHAAAEQNTNRSRQTTEFKSIFSIAFSMSASMQVL